VKSRRCLRATQQNTVTEKRGFACLAGRCSLLIPRIQSRSHFIPNVQLIMLVESEHTVGRLVQIHAQNRQPVTRDVEVVALILLRAEQCAGFVSCHKTALDWAVVWAHRNPSFLFAPCSDWRPSLIDTVMGDQAGPELHRCIAAERALLVGLLTLFLEMREPALSVCDAFGSTGRRVWLGAGNRAAAEWGRVPVRANSNG
jgi:hypothetical protein